MSKAFLQCLSDILKVSRESPILLTCKGGTTSIGTYSSYHSVVYACDTDLDDFTAVISNEVARQLQRSLNENGLKIVQTAGGLKIICAGLKTTVATLTENITLTKLLSKYSGDETHSVNGELLKQAFVRVKPSADDKSIGDVVLRGYHMTTNAETLELMATNGAVLTTVLIPCESELDNSTVLLNPEFHHLASLLPNENISLRQAKDTLSVYAETEDSKMFAVSNFTSGSPVPYASVVESAMKNPIVVRFNTRDFLEGLRKLSFFTDESLRNKVEITVFEDLITLYANNSHGDFLVELGVDESHNIPLAGLKMVTSHSNLIGFFNSSKSLTTEMRMQDSKSPIYLTDGFVHQVAVLHHN
jgi:hypothetical protein